MQAVRPPLNSALQSRVTLSCQQAVSNFSLTARYEQLFNCVRNSPLESRVFFTLPQSEWTDTQKMVAGFAGAGQSGHGDGDREVRVMAGR